MEESFASEATEVMTMPIDPLETHPLDVPAALVI